MGKLDLKGESILSELAERQAKLDALKPLVELATANFSLVRRKVTDRVRLLRVASKKQPLEVKRMLAECNTVRDIALKFNIEETHELEIDVTAGIRHLASVIPEVWGPEKDQVVG